MSTRKIWNGTQWVQIGASINDIEIVTSSAGAVDPSKLYFVASDATPGDLVTFRVNGKLGSGVWFGGNELWTPTQQATGGTETIIDVAGTPYKVHTFTTSGDFEVLIPSLNVEYLCVGGGGNGGGSSAGRGAGGGAGGDVYSSTTILNVGIYNCSVAVASNTAFDTIHTSLKGGDGAVSGTDNGGGGGSNSTASGGAPSSGVEEEVERPQAHRHLEAREEMAQLGPPLVYQGQLWSMALVEVAEPGVDRVLGAVVVLVLEMAVILGHP